MISRLILAAMVGLALACGSAARADDPPAAEYVLGIEDVVQVTVANHSDLNTSTTISPDGTIVIPEAGEVKAVGLTARKLAALIQMKLEVTLNNVSVTVTVKESHPAKLMVRVLGATHTTGALEMRPKWRLIDLIVAAGGLTVKQALVTGRIVRGTQVISADVPEAFAHPEGDANLLLQPGDLVLLDEREVFHPQVSVQGQVEKPGMYDLDETSTLSGILTQTLGPTPRAALSKAYVLRKGQRVPIDLRPALAGQNIGADGNEFKLQPNDVLYIPEITEKFAVMGEIHQVGSFPFPPSGKITVLEAYTQVGGSSKEGDLSNAGIIRFTNGKYDMTPVNISKLLAKNSKEVNPELKPGDTLYVPPRRSKGGFSWSALLAPLSTLSLMGLHF